MRTPVGHRASSNGPERRETEEVRQLKKMHALEKRLTCLERDSQRMQKREMRQKLRAVSRKKARA